MPAAIAVSEQAAPARAYEDLSRFQQQSLLRALGEIVRLQSDLWDALRRFEKGVGAAIGEPDLEDDSLAAEVAAHVAEGGTAAGVDHKFTGAIFNRMIEPYLPSAQPCDPRRVEHLQRADVCRAIEQTPAEQRADMALYITTERPDLADAVEEALRDLAS